MEQYLTILSTAIITVTTIIYTFYSIRLWRTSHASANIMRQAALANLWAELNHYLKICKAEARPEAVFLQKLSAIFAEFMILSLINHAGAKNDPHLTAVKHKIAEAVEGEEVDVSLLNWLAPLLEK